MRYHKVTLFFAVFLALLPSIYATDQGRFGSLADYLNRIYGIDNNAGLTTFPILNIPMGGRSEGMGSAFSAVADDISFLEHNPAGSSKLTRTELAFFHNNWIADTNLGGVAYTTRFGNFGIGAGAKILYTPFTEYNIYGERVSGGFYSEGVAILNASYNFFSGYYFSGLSLGINLKGAFRIMPDFTDEYDAIISGSGLSQSAAMAMVDIGLLTRFNFLKFYTARENNASAAFVIRNLGPPALNEPLPTLVNIGLSYRPIRPLIFAFDFNFPVNLMNVRLSGLPFFAFGFSANVTNFLSMHSGVMLRAGSSRLTVGSAINLEKISIDINYTLDLLTQMQPMNRISLGVRFDLGDRGRQQKMDLLNELYILGFDAYLAGDRARARYYWEQALALDPRYEPARESLAWLTGREDLDRRIEELFRMGF